MRGVQQNALHPSGLKAAPGVNGRQSSDSHWFPSSSCSKLPLGQDCFPLLQCTLCCLGPAQFCSPVLEEASQTKCHQLQHSLQHKDGGEHVVAVLEGCLQRLQEQRKEA